MNFVRGTGFAVLFLAAVISGRAQTGLPILSQPIPNQTINRGLVEIDLKNHYIQPTGLRPRFLERLSDQGIHFPSELFQNESGSVPLAMRR